jgi:hypothetical protein
MQKDKFDFISLYGLISSHVFRYRKLLVVIFLLSGTVSTLTTLRRPDVSSGEFILRIGDQSELNISDMVLVLDQHSLKTGLDTNLFSSNQEYRLFYRHLSAFRGIEPSVYNRSNFKIIVSYDDSFDFEIPLEEVVLKAFKYNKTLNDYIINQIELVDREISLLNAAIEGKNQIEFSDDMLNRSSVDLLMSRFAISDMAALSQIRLDFELTKARLTNFAVISSIEYQSARMLKVRFFLLNFILICFVGFVFTIILSIHSEYKKRLG